MRPVPPREMRDDSRAAMDLGHDAEADRERELHGLAPSQAHVPGLDEDTGGAQVLRAAQPALARRQKQVDRCTCAMSCRQSSFHGAALYRCCDG